jgi:hypothetical protein
MELNNRVWRSRTTSVRRRQSRATARVPGRLAVFEQGVYAEVLSDTLSHGLVSLPPRMPRSWTRWTAGSSSSCGKSPRLLATRLTDEGRVPIPGIPIATDASQAALVSSPGGRPPWCIPRHPAAYSPP